MTEEIMLQTKEVLFKLAVLSAIEERFPSRDFDRATLTYAPFQGNAITCYIFDTSGAQINATISCQDLIYRSLGS